MTAFEFTADDPEMAALRWHNPAGWHWGVEREPRYRSTTIHIGPVYIERGPASVVMMSHAFLFCWRV